MAHVDVVLRPPPYGWKDDDGNLVRPSTMQMLTLFAQRFNVLKSRKQWIVLTSWSTPILTAPFLVAFFGWHFTWPLLFVGFVYGMIGMGSHGTVWYHRFGTHQAYTFSHPIWRFLTRNIVIKALPEETYIVSHFVHHARSDKPGDPYHPEAGFLYCFLADALHQPIAHDLSEADYGKACAYVEHTGIRMNSYAQYQRWGSIANPLHLWTHKAANWAFWFTVLYMAGGMSLVSVIFGSVCVWAVGVRTFNYGAHGAGKDQRREGQDFSTRDQSINQLWPGMVAGEWHSNHHLFARSARTGYKWWQIDLPYYYIRALHAIGGISSYNDSRDTFFRKYYQPWLDAQAEKKGSGNAESPPSIGCPQAAAVKVESAGD
ncbi:MAG: fatty acid desaturase [Myxococcota bacterium]